MNKSCKEILKNIEATIKDIKRLHMEEIKNIAPPAPSAKTQVKTT